MEDKDYSQYMYHGCWVIIDSGSELLSCGTKLSPESMLSNETLGESCAWNFSYCKISNTRRTQSPNLNVSRLVLQLSLPNPMKPGVKLRMKM